MITHTEAVFNALVEIGEPAQYRTIKNKVDMSQQQLYESLRFLVSHGRINRDFIYTKHVRKGMRRLVWSVK